jgi:hypothetical protein
MLEMGWSAQYAIMVTRQVEAMEALLWTGEAERDRGQERSRGRSGRGNKNKENRPMPVGINPNITISINTRVLGASDLKRTGPARGKKVRHW